MRPGGGRGHGVAALFAGDSGTGKTMSAEVVAQDLGLDLYVVDLATVVDKYVGETEKNLERIFTAAAGVNGVLLFDEADAVFGRRSEVKDAHDRYANVESAYLLQRMETFDGLAILATNLRANIDEAFTRRLDVVVDFPLPDAAHRTRAVGPLPRTHAATGAGRRPRLPRAGRSSWPAAPSAPPRSPPPTWRRTTAGRSPCSTLSPPCSASTASWAGCAWRASSARTGGCWPPRPDRFLSRRAARSGSGRCPRGRRGGACGPPLPGASSV